MNKKNKGIGAKVVAIALTSFMTIGSFSNTAFATNVMVPLDTSVVKYNIAAKDNKDNKTDKNKNNDKCPAITDGKENNSCLVVTTERTNEIINSIRARKEKSLDAKLINSFNEYLDNLVSYVNLSIKYKLTDNNAKVNELAKTFNEIYNKKDELKAEDINKFMKTEIPVLDINKAEDSEDGQPGGVIADKDKEKEDKKEEDKKEEDKEKEDKKEEDKKEDKKEDIKENDPKVVLEKARELQKKLESKDKDFKEHYNLEISEFNRSIRYLAYWSTSTNEAAKDKLPEAIDIANSWSAFFNDLLKSGENPIKDTEKTPEEQSKEDKKDASTQTGEEDKKEEDKKEEDKKEEDKKEDKKEDDKKEDKKEEDKKEDDKKDASTQTGEKDKKDEENKTGETQTPKDNGKKEENKSSIKPSVTIEKKVSKDGNKGSTSTTPKVTTENKNSGSSSSSSTSTPSNSSSSSSTTAPSTSTSTGSSSSTSSPSSTTDSSSSISSPSSTTSSSTSSTSSSTSSEATTPDDGKRDIKIDVGENGLTFYVFDVTLMKGDSTKTGKELEDEILEKAQKENWGEKEPLYKLETKTVDGKDGVLEFEGEAGKIYYVYPSSTNSTKVDDLVIALPAIEKSENGSGKGVSSTTENGNGKGTATTPDNGKGTANAPQTNDPNIIGKVAGGLAAGGAIASGAYLYTKRNKKDNDIIPDGLDIK